MLEIILGIAICVVVAKTASADDQSAVVWFGVTFAMCVGALYINLPYLRFLIAGAASFATLIGYRVMANK